MPTRTEKVNHRSSEETLSSSSQKLIEAIAAAGMSPVDEIKILDALILKAKARRNLLVPIARMLPVEVLGEIFEYAISEFNSEQSQRSYNPWVAIMLVCRPWRDVAATHPALWTNLTKRNVMQWPAFIERSRGLSIDITLSTNSGIIGTSLDAALSQLHRVRSLELRASQTLLEKVLLRLNHAAPRLIRLLLQNLSNGWCDALEGAFVSEHMPNLRNLSLTGVSFPWGHRAPNLHTLSISRQKYGSRALSTNFNASQVLQSLCSPSMEEIHIEDIPLPGPQAVTAVAANITVPPAQLKVLRLRNVVAELALPLWFATSDILDTLKETFITLVALPNAFTPAYLDNIVAHTVTHIANHPDNVKSLRIQISWRFYIDSDMLKFNMPTPPFSVSGDVVSRLMAATSPDHLTTLELELKDVDLSAAALEDMLSRAPRIVNLKLSIPPAMLHQLCILLSRHATTNSAHAPLLPMLRTLDLEHMDLTQPYKNRPSYTFMSTMLHWRRLRAPNLGPSTVGFRRCTMTSTIMTSFSVGGQITVRCDHPPADSWALGAEVLGADPWPLGDIEQAEGPGEIEWGVWV